MVHVELDEVYVGGKRFDASCLKTSNRVRSFRPTNLFRMACWRATATRETRCLTSWLR